MSYRSRRIDRLETTVTGWLDRYSVGALRISLGVVFFWFGILKFVPGASPAQDLAVRTIDLLTFGLIPADVSLALLATWECLIGIGLITGKLLRTALLLQLLQMLGTITPLFFFPDETFLRFPYAPTLEGQYIIKNIVLVTAALVIAATLGGRRLFDRPRWLVKAPASATD